MAKLDFLPDQPKTNLSFLPDKPQEEKQDLSFLPDRPEKDISFLPDKQPEPRREPRNIFERLAPSVTRGIEEVTEFTRRPVKKSLELEEKAQEILRVGERQPIPAIIGGPLQIIADTELLRPSTYIPLILGQQVAIGGLEKVATIPIVRRFMQKRLPTLLKNVLKRTNLPKEPTNEFLKIKKRTLVNNEFVTSEREFLKGQGKAARELVNRLDDIQNKGEINLGNSVADYTSIRKGMSKNELANFVDVVEGRALPISNKVKGLQIFWETKRDLIAREAAELGFDVKSIRNSRGQAFKEILNFKPRENYFPHLIISPDSPLNVVDDTLRAAVKRGDFFDLGGAKSTWNSYVAFSKSGQKGERIFQFLVDSKQVSDKAEASKLLSTWIRRGRQRRFGNLERARDIDLPFYDTNPDRVLPKYFGGAFHRLEEVRQLGTKDQGVKQLINQIREEGGDWKNAQVMFERWAGKEPERLVFGALTPEAAQKIRGFQTVTKLGLAQIPNSTQSINTAYVTGIKNTAKAIQRATTQAGQEFAVRTGAVLDSTIDDVIRRATGGIGRIPKVFLKRTGFFATERMNRVIAANAGREYALEMTRKILANPASKSVRRALTELGLSADDIVTRGNITLNELLLSGQKIVNKSQFRSGILDLPLFFSSPEGRIITQFKNFAFNQTKLMKDAILLEAARGNLKPIITAITLMPILGEGVKDLRAILTGRSRDKQGIERIAENMSAVGGLGIISDLWQSASIRKFTGAIAGPTISDISDISESVVQLLQGKPSPFGRTVARKVPVIGQLLSRTLFPSKRGSAGRKLRQLRKI